MTDDVVVSYKLDARHEPGSHGGIVWKDPELATPWPSATPILSDKDRNLLRMRDCKPLL